ncbi:MAG: PLP-dependent aminotransferase family protein [Myxococcota bacterium]
MDQLVQFAAIEFHIGEGPLYQQLFDEIVRRIRNGALPAGHRLPPTRVLAKTVGAHRNTVVRAYEALEDAGFVDSTVGRGTFVAAAPAPQLTPVPDIDAPRSAGVPWSRLASRATRVEPLSRWERVAQHIQTKKEVINLTRMQPCGDLLPTALFKRCIDHVLRTMAGRALEYSPREGLPRLREAVCRDLARQGVACAPDDILITTGSQQALDLVARSLVDPGDAFLVDATTYAGAVTALGAAGAQLIPFPSDDFGPDPSAIQQLGDTGVKGAYLMPGAHNPTGRRTTATRRAALLRWSRQAGIPLIEDDYAADLQLDDIPAPAPLRAADGEVVYIGTYSKKLIPALRVGFVLAPTALRPHLVALKQTVDLGTSALMQHALAEFLERGYLEPHLERIRPEYRRRRDALVEGLNDHLPAGFKVRSPAAGHSTWLSLPPGVEPSEVFRAAQDEGVLVSPSTLFQVGNRAERGLRLTFCTEPPGRLAEGAVRLARALRRLRPTAVKIAEPDALGVT